MDILQMSARTLSQKIQGGEISVKEAVEAYKKQMEKMEPEVHAFLSVEDDKLALRIKEVEEGIKSGRYQGPLAGVPIAVKDNICTKGQKTTCSSKMLENFVPAYDAEAVKRINDAGMIILGKTNMDEFAMGSTTETSAFGVTKNPWNTEHVPGGSSGGSCAAVAAGETPIALGSDTGGSIRQPAAYCGVTGLKPTYGRVSRYGLIAYASSLDQIGPIGKDVKDCAALFEVLSGHDAKDSTSADEPIESWESMTSGNFSGMKIGIPKEYLAEGTDAEVKQALETAVQMMSEAGAEVEYFSLGMVDYVIPAYYIIACAEASSNLERFDGVKYGYRNPEATELHDMYKRSRAEGFGEEVRRRILLGSFVLSAGYYDAYYLKALKAKGLIKKEFDKAFEKYDCILAPAAPTTAPKIGTSLSDPLQMYLSDIYTVAVNLAGLPAVSMPCAMDSKGLPIGMQLIGDCFQEKKILKAAAAFEELRGPFKGAWEKEDM
ncbi:MAG: Asp-tRNA(Asn)/Glu-tRNA(Gln) amidotransferase subunit GatA [Clostridia bacterium]|nr:Asp-tRNA(Asn)/Glu-tRNA(Gln) amidotransferase subunit GatA [Clostridia bacterium]NCC42722.1 Asp-tRNA(Asn)/Glu-tRNA(Gln) amidotransferase subunit GatA [Clostridia bacterium]